MKRRLARAGRAIWVFVECWGRTGLVCLRRRPTGGVVWNANRGAISRRAIMRGKAVDVGRQFEGVNAFERALPAMVRLADTLGRMATAKAAMNR